MGRHLSALVMIVAALLVGPSAAAQSDQPPAPSARSAQISDDELHTFAKIYTVLQESKSKLEAMLVSAQTEEEAAKIRADFDEETTSTLSKLGWTVDKFNSFVTTINSDPELAERASALTKG
jgi:hypothetical protein